MSTEQPLAPASGTETAALDGLSEVRRQLALLKTGALQNAILHSANFSIIATDEKGIIQFFNVGAERMLGYKAAEVVTPILPGFEALAFKASRGIEDTYDLTYVCKDGSRFPAVVSITALRDDYDGLIGYRLSAADATAGIALARLHQPAVILMDINLPGISGIRALKLLREDPLTRHIPVIAISANAMPHDVRRGLEAGFFSYLTKPTRVDAFMAAMDVALEASKLARASAAPKGVLQ